MIDNELNELHLRKITEVIVQYDNNTGDDVKQKIKEQDEEDVAEITNINVTYKNKNGEYKHFTFINREQIISTTIDGDFALNLVKPFKKEDGAEVKQLIVKVPKTANDHRRVAGIVNDYMKQNNIKEASSLNVELQAGLFDKLFLDAVIFNGERVSLTLFNSISVDDYALLAKILQNNYIAFFR